MGKHNDLQTGPAALSQKMRQRDSLVGKTGEHSRGDKHFREGNLLLGDYPISNNPDYSEIDQKRQDFY
ncbi:MAG: hypothetical protein ACRYG5_15475 [Janthinobacterium lividum]